MSVLTMFGESEGRLGCSCRLEDEYLAERVGLGIDCSFAKRSRLAACDRMKLWGNVRPVNKRVILATPTTHLRYSRIKKCLTHF